MFCKLFYESTFLPISCYFYEKDKIISFPDKEGFQANISNPSPKFQNFKKNPDYFVTEYLGYYGYIDSPNHDYCLLLGPIFSTSVTEDTIHAFMKEWSITSDFRYAVVQFLENIPLHSLQFMLHYVN